MTNHFMDRVGRKLRSLTREQRPEDIAAPPCRTPAQEPAPVETVTEAPSAFPLMTYTEPVLTRAEAAAANGDVSETLAILRDLSLDDFGEIFLNLPHPAYSALSRLLPAMASDEVQRNWTGNAGPALLQQTTTFVRAVNHHYRNLKTTDLRDKIILDFGCGYGHILRLMTYFTGPERLYGFDPWDQSIALCQEARILAQLAVSDYLPTTLPHEGIDFDVIYCSSVFSHLSERATAQTLAALRRRIKPDGLLVITIRPVEYWDHDQRVGPDLKAELLACHRDTGFAFQPHKREAIDGDITYGDTTMTFDYIERTFPDWCLRTYDHSLTDPLQIILFLEPV